VVEIFIIRGPGMLRKYSLHEAEPSRAAPAGPFKRFMTDFPRSQGAVQGDLKSSGAGRISIAERATIVVVDGKAEATQPARRSGEFHWWGRLPAGGPGGRDKKQWKKSTTLLRHHGSSHFRDGKILEEEGEIGSLTTRGSRWLTTARSSQGRLIPKERVRLRRLQTRKSARNTGAGYFRTVHLPPNGEP